MEMTSYRRRVGTENATYPSAKVNGSSFLPEKSGDRTETLLTEGNVAFNRTSILDFGQMISNRGPQS